MPNSPARLQAAFPWLVKKKSSPRWRDLEFKLAATQDRQSTFNAADLGLADEVIMVNVAIQRSGTKHPVVLPFYRNRGERPNGRPDGTFTSMGWGYDMPELTMENQTFKVQFGDERTA